MPLNDLSLEDLTEISGNLFTLETVGRDLADAGLAPRFDLTPGEAVTITTGFRMPAIESPRVTFRVQSPLDEGQLDRAIKAVVISTEAAPPEPAHEPVDAPPVDEGPAGGATEPAAPSRSDDETPPPPGVAEATPPPLAKAASSEGVADSGGGQQPAAAEPPAAPPAPTNERAFSGAAVWTPEEDARLITLVVIGVTRLGLSKSSAMKAAAQELGRPEAGTAFRCHHKLKDRLDAALAWGSAFLDQPDEEPGPTPYAEAAPTPAGGDAAGEGTTPPAVQPIANELIVHLMDLPEKGAFGAGWTLERDRELMELSIAGWMPNEIGLELQVQANQVKARFDALTGLYDDASRKKLRRFTREAMQQALKRLVEAQKGAA